MSDVFVSLSFSPKFNEVYRAINAASKKIGLVACRVDQGKKAVLISEDLPKKIRESRIVVADLTGNNPNVLHEIGLTQSLGKPLVLISQDPPETAPFNIRSFRIIHYSPRVMNKLRIEVEKALKETTTPNEALRSILVPSSLGRPTKDSRFVIAASPLSFRRAVGREGGYNCLRRSYSDYVGLRSIMQAFGLLYGFDALPDSIDPEDFEDSVLQEEMNLYCIASPKANRWTGLLLEEYGKLKIPCISFRADPTSKNLKNVKVSIFSDDVTLLPDGWDSKTAGDRYYRDFGIIIRGPNPYHETHMVTILAGRASLGTEAACMAFTHPEKINEIRQRLMGLKLDIEDHKQSFYALVSMKRHHDDGKEEADPRTLEVEEVSKLRKSN